MIGRQCSEDVLLVCVIVLAAVIVGQSLVIWRWLLR